MEIQPTFDSWTAIFLVVALHGIVLAGLFFLRREGRLLPNWLLGVFLLLFSLNLIGNVFYWTKYYVEVPHLIGIQATFHFIYGPLLFFYALSVVTPDRSWKIRDLMHAVPLAVFIVWMFPFFILQGDDKIAGFISFSDSADIGLSTNALIIAAIKIVLMTGYGAAVLLLSKFGVQWFQIKSNRLHDKIRRWLKTTGWAFLGFVISFASYFILVETINFRIEHDYVISFAMAAFIFGIGYMGLLKPEFLEEAHNGRFKYENSSLSEKEADSYLERLITYMTEHQPYLDGNLKILDLANQLSIPSHHLSQIINERLDKNFFEFVNAYRIEEAKKMLADPGKKDFKILRVAFESGFNNKTTFNVAFKEEVGTTPSQYRRQQLQEKKQEIL